LSLGSTGISHGTRFQDLTLLTSISISFSTSTLPISSLSPDLFPSFPQSESSYREEIRAAFGEEEGGNIGDQENVVSRHHNQFSETIPVFPFEADYFSSPSVAATLAQQIYGYSGVGHREKK
jgi:hypothetical protein